MSPGELGPMGISGVVERPRLYRILDSPLVRICALQAPSGSGKTTLLRSWLHRHPPTTPTIWVSLSSATSGRRAFWQQVVGSAARLGELTAPTLARVQEQLNLSADPVRLAAALLAKAGPVLFVIDAYEHLGPAMAEIDHDLMRLVDETPGLRLMVTTRTSTGLSEFSIADGTAARTLTTRDLTLNRDEIGALIQEQVGLTDERVAASMLAATRGYALAARAAVLALARHGRLPRSGPWSGANSWRPRWRR